MIPLHMSIGGPCKVCGRPDIEHGNGRCPTTQQVTDAVERLKARLAADPAFAKAMLPGMTHDQVKATLRPRQADPTSQVCCLE